MNKRRLGCFSVSSMIAACFTLSMIVGIALASGNHMFSPGPLNAQAGERPIGEVWTHADTGRKCAACHTAPWSRESMAMRCISCHTEIEAALQATEDLHGAVMVANDKIICRDCHTEHQGSDGLLTILDKDNFSHDLVGFSLSGHQTNLDGKPFECADCHQDDITRFEANTCGECHLEVDAAFTREHAQIFGRDCLGCHTGSGDFSSDFDHSQTSFPLEGKHIKVACKDCHTQGITAKIESSCYSCHKQDDEHRGSYGTDCGGCHTPDDWENANFKHTFPINHEKRGGSACQVCHPDTLQTYTCYGCHEHTPDKIKREHREEGISNYQNCMDCHPDGRE